MKEYASVSLAPHIIGTKIEMNFTDESSPVREPETWIVYTCCGDGDCDVLKHFVHVNCHIVCWSLYGAND